MTTETAALRAAIRQSSDGVHRPAGARGSVCRRLGRRLGFWLIFLAAYLVAPLPVFAAGGAAGGDAGSIAGRLLNGTAGGESTGSVEVILYAFRGTTLDGDQTAQTDAQGTFRFDALHVGDDRSYRIGTVYAGAAYATDVLRLTTQAPELQVDLPVYEATSADPGLGTAQSLLIIGGIDAERQELAVMELVTLTNPTDRTFVPRPGGPGGPMALVRFGLPVDARDLRPTMGLDPEGVVQVDRGFGSFTPVAPGEHEVGFTYRVPFRADRLVIEKSFVYGSGFFRVLVPDRGPDLSGPGLTAAEPVEIGGMRFRVWTAQALTPGARLTLQLTGLPARPAWRVALQERAAAGLPLAIPAALAFALLAGSRWAIRTRTGARQPALSGRWPAPSLRRASPPALLSGSTAASHPEPAALLHALADLDDGFAAGQLTAPAYTAQRDALKGRLKALLVPGGTAAVEAASVSPAPVGPAEAPGG